MGFARVEMDGFVLPVVDELTGAQRRELFVPLDKEYHDVADGRIFFPEDGTLDSVCLSILAYGQGLSDANRRKQELRYHQVFSKRFLEEQQSADSRRVRGVGYAADALGATPLLVALAESAYHIFPDIASYFLAIPALQIAAGTVGLAYSAVESIAKARSRQCSANLADHLSTNTVVLRGSDTALHDKIRELHAHYDSIDGPSAWLNEQMATKAASLGLPAVSRFYNKRNKTRDPGLLYEGLERGILRAGVSRAKRKFIRDELGMLGKMAKRLGRVAPQQKSGVSIPVTLLPTMRGYELLVGYTDDDNLDHLAMRLGRGDAVNLCFEVFAPKELSDEVKQTLERDLPNVIHDNLYCDTRGWHVVPAAIHEKTGRWGRIASYVCGTIGMGIGAGALFFGIAPIAGACVALSSTYLVGRAAFLSKRQAAADIVPHKTAIRGHDKIQEMLKEGIEPRYSIDPSLHIFEQIILSNTCAHEAYVRCVQEAKRIGQNGFAAAYIIKAHSVEPIHREEQVGLLEIER